MDYDFIKGFAGVNMLEAEAISKVAGRVVGGLHTGMTEAGLSGDQATLLIQKAVHEILQYMVTLTLGPDKT